ncbi:GLPGLI family protein [Chryseobacterium tructae]|uniref:GLPGLI family protein n=1 Tax=Chryseobacterium tructae TaxID=1037380 RepID=UPI0025B5743E|nr:GLPGLI family protein [Chryseobacterium tructae]MDN3694903.1 GLPGLI family protein [Chryseobacterium tructae]
MNKYFIFIFCFIQYSYAQNYRAIYDFNYKLDSTKSYSDTIEMVLDIQKEDSKFYYKKLIKLDSLVRNNEIISFSFPIQQVIKRNRNSFENENFVNVDDKYYYYFSTDKINWKIMPEVKYSNHYTLQKAEAVWSGRKWTAWFTPEIPISEGPYKFKGLPGLIIELEDSHRNFGYKLMSFNKLASDYNTHNIVETNLGNVPIKISLKKYQELVLTQYNNPFSEYNNMKEGSWGLTIDDKEINTFEGLKSIKKDYQLKIKRNYNPIELDKAVEYK